MVENFDVGVVSAGSLLMFQAMREAFEMGSIGAAHTECAARPRSTLGVLPGS